MSVMRFSAGKMENPSGLPILPHLWRQMPSRIVDYSGKPSSLYLGENSTIAQFV